MLLEMGRSYYQQQLLNVHSYFSPRDLIIMVVYGDSTLNQLFPYKSIPSSRPESVPYLLKIRGLDLFDLYGG